MADFDPDSRDRLLDLHERLRSVLELPIERDASNWVAEADALVGDLVDREASPTVRRKRLTQVRELLEEVEGTGHERADEHVDAAKRLTVELLGELEESDQ
ncbi:hypothetical protein AArcSl_2409 [Halalkaliarchaeum desulfuricum]|uniref:DUF8152 domain-containing protein n=1 Tax=Halalkaliarchaeum desulfuricum TaxID=2055893 RepID=A0A343TLQ9_9EURY|nr:hypothetical protein [Halalkaliarchaeum desulfuricum]AUX10031.1 hypothetical protein AArcSl_2409 [Halalkaliarchaeum desulfuricum]